MAVVARPPFSGYTLPGSSGGGVLSSIAQFSDTTDQQLVANTPAVVRFNSTDYAAGGISVVAGTQLTVAATGTYRFDVSLQMQHSGGVTVTITFWARINGVNVPNSASSIEMGNNNDRALPYVALLLPMVAGQYVEWVVMTSDVNTSIEHFPAVVGPPAVPAIPSAIAGVYRLA